MRQGIRRTVILVFFLLFPIVMNYISPYVPTAGAAEGFITLSIFMFGLMLISAIFLGRLWCSWICPVSALHEACITIRGKRVNAKKLRVIRYSIFAVWILSVVSMFALSGGIKGINLFYFTDNGISVDVPGKYVIYYGVLFIIVILNLTLGKRGFCHSVCWMSPFLTAGYHIGRLLKIPKLAVKADSTKCTSCGICDKKCQMCINVKERVRTGGVFTSECILCGECIDGCPSKALKMGFK